MLMLTNSQLDWLAERVPAGGPSFDVIPAQAGIQWVRVVVPPYGSGPLLAQG